MSKEAYKNLIHDPVLWKCDGTGMYNQNLLNGLKERIGHYPTWYSCRSRNLEYALRNVISKYHYGSVSTGAKHIIPLCELILGKEIVFKNYFLNISSTEAENLTFENLKHNLLDQSRVRENDTNAYIHLVVVAKGKTYVRNTLDGQNDLNRIKPIEVLGIENTQHFLRIYKNLLGNPGDITVFSDQMTEDLLHLLVLQMPNLFNITPLETEETNQHILKRNAQIEALRSIFACLFSLFTTNENSVSAAYRFELKQHFDEFSKLFDFTIEQTKTFLDALSKARVQKADKYYNNIINNANSSIKTLEEQLASKYREKHDALLVLNGINKEGAEDISEFEKILSTNKAIEMLEINPTEIKIRVTAPLQYYQKSDYELYERNPSSYVNRQFNEAEKKLLHEIFVSQQYKLLLQAIIRLRIQTDSYSSDVLECRVNSNSEFSNYTQFPNPHLYHHNCWSAARNEINKCIARGDYSLAIMQMISAVQSVNVAENTSFINGLLYDIYEREDMRNKITLVKKDGTQLTWSEALREIRNEPKEQKTEPVTKKPTYTQTVISEEPPEDITDADEAELNEYHRTVDDEYIPENNREEVLPF